MRDAVCLAAMMPARRAVCNGSPFATFPLRMRLSAAALIVISPRASASRLVTGLPPTSTMRALPPASTCDNRAAAAGRAWRLAILLFPLGQIERQAFERYGQIHALEFYVLRDLERTRREIEDRLHASHYHLINDRLGMWSGHGDHGDVEPLAPHDLLEFLDVVDRNATARLVAD